MVRKMVARGAGTGSFFRQIRLPLSLLLIKSSNLHLSTMERRDARPLALNSTERLT
jgi:hypothetical protein